MKLADYISQQIDLGVTNFDIGLNRDGTVDDRSPTRVKFKITKLEKK